LSNVAALFGEFALDDYREAIFQLCYQQHGGSGLNFSYEGVQQMPLSDFTWYLERLESARSKETHAIEAASPKRRSA
jgi:hypothetical protein